MRKIGKGLPALICCMLLVCGIAVTAMAAPTENCPGGCSHAAAIGTTHYDSLAEALSAATNGCTVTVLADQTVPALTLDKAITLDLGGKTLTGQNTQAEAMVSVTGDITIKNGTLSAPMGTALRASGCAVMLDRTVTVTAAAGNAIELAGSGKLTITGGTYTAQENTVVFNPAEGKTIEASVTGGKFTAANGQTLLVNLSTNSSVSAGCVTGGIFNKVPTAYIPANCRTTDNGDGTFTVTAQYNITYAPNGGSGTMSGSTADRGTTITLPNCTLTAPAGKHFAGWEVNGNTYAPGASFALNGDLHLKALWASHSGGSATCTAPAKCSTCGASYGSTASHALVASGGTPATCTEKGMNSHSRCSSCGQYFVSGIAIKASSLTIPALGHEMKTVEGTEATCTEDGILTHQACAHCGVLEVEGQTVTHEQLTVPATGHETEPVAAVAATCTQPGTKAHERCANCNLLFENGKEITAEQLTTPVNTHLLSDWQQDSTTHWKTCTGCSEVFRQHSHKDSDADSTCDDCGYAMAASQEMIPAEEEEKPSFPFWIPILAAVVIATGGLFIATGKKSK